MGIQKLMVYSQLAHTAARETDMLITQSTYTDTAVHVPDPVLGLQIEW